MYRRNPAARATVQLSSPVEQTTRQERAAA
jgi:hypothetical protein